MKIWVLLSIANEYDQPDNNLVCWWRKKPSFNNLVVALNIKVDKEKGDADVGRVLKGGEMKRYETTYRLEEIEEGECLSR